MNNKLSIFLTIIGLIGLLSGCEKDETKVTLSDNTIVPEIGTLPNLTLQRTNGTDTLTFVGTPVDPGFQASVNYFLEACAHGNNFKDSVLVLTDIQDTAMKITVSDLNGILIKKFPADQASSLDFRIRSVLVVDAGTGFTPLAYISEIKTADVTIYGLPRLDLLNSGIDQKVESALGDGNYLGYVKLDDTKAFTLKNPDTGVEYGGSGGTLAVDGAAISSDANGWYKLSVDVNNLTYELAPYMVGVVGEFTGWGGSSDYFMDYDSQKGYWYITIDLPVGPMKFRLNSDWTYNWGPGADTDLPSNGGTLALPNTNGNINITAAGNYTIHFTITGTTSGSVTFIKN